MEIIVKMAEKRKRQDDHDNSPRKLLKDLYGDKKCVSNDFTVVSAEGRNFPVIFAILLKTSDYFGLCAKGKNAKSDQLKTDIPAKILDRILKYCYTRKKPKLFDSIADNIEMIHAFDMWLLNNVARELDEDLVETVTFYNVVDVLNSVVDDPTCMRTEFRCLRFFSDLIEFKKTGRVCFDAISDDNVRYCCAHYYDKTEYADNTCCKKIFKWGETCDRRYSSKLCCRHGEHDEHLMYKSDEWTMVDTSKLSQRAHERLFESLF